MSGGTGRRRKPPVGEEGGEQQYAPQQPPAEPYPQYQTYQQPAAESYDYDWRQGSAEQVQEQQPPAARGYEAPAAYGYEVPAAPAYDAPAARGYEAPAAPGYEAPAAYEQPVYQPSQYAEPQQPVQHQPVQHQPIQQPSVQSSPYAEYPYQAYQQQSAPAAPPAAPAAPAPAPAATSTDYFGSGSYEIYFGSGSYEIPQQQSAAPARPRPTPRVEPQPEPVAAPSPVVPPQPQRRPEPEPFEFEFDPEDEPSAQAAASAAGSAEASAAPSGPVTGHRPADKDGYRADDFSFVDEPDNPDVKGWLSFSESRADSRAERIRTMRARLIAVGIVLVLIAAGVGVYVWLGGSVPGLTNQSTDTKQMILFRLDDSKGDAVGDALLVTDRSGPTANGTATGSGAIVVIPSQMQIDSSGFGSSTFGGNMASDQPPAGQDAVASTFGVTPDGVRDMDETTFGIFVDEIGGLSVITNTAVPASTADPKGVPLGATTLTGVQAVAYATYPKTGDSATAQAQRFGQVMDALIAKLPSYTNEVTSYLNLLGLIPDPSLPLSKLSPILAVLAAQHNAGQVTLATLPLSSSGTLDAGSAASIVSKLLGGTVQASATASG